MTTYEYDGDRLVRSVTVEDPEWSDDDVDYALAWVEEERHSCPGCGQPRAVSFARESDDAYRVTAHRCHSCAAKGRAAEKFDGDRHGMFWATEHDG